MKKTKATIKHNNSSTSNKYKGFLKRKFNLQSRKVQFFVVILIIAVIGGGYFAYKSFAASPMTAFFHANDTTIAVQKTGKCAYSTFKEPAKNNALVWTLSCPYDRTNVGQFVTIATETYYPSTTGTVNPHCVSHFAG